MLHPGRSFESEGAGCNGEGEECCGGLDEGVVASYLVDHAVGRSTPRHQRPDICVWSYTLLEIRYSCPIRWRQRCPSFVLTAFTYALRHSQTLAQDDVHVVHFILYAFPRHLRPMSVGRKPDPIALLRRPSSSVMLFSTDTLSHSAVDNVLSRPNRRIACNADPYLRKAKGAELELHANSAT